MSTVTFARLQKFCKIRARSHHQSNLQFQIDWEAAGMDWDEMKGVEKGRLGNLILYRWKFPCGVLIELGGRCDAYSPKHAPSLERATWFSDGVELSPADPTLSLGMLGPLP